MKILLFGGSGQLGYEIRKRAHDLNFELISPVSSEVDVGNYDQVRFLSEKVRPDLFLNCAAYTAVDKAEVEKDAAFRINRDGARNVALAAATLGKRAIYVSTDYVFKGDGGVPLRETDSVDPQGVYAASKLAGEIEVEKALGSRGVIVRTSSLHGHKGINFVNTMLKLFAEKPEVKVVADQHMSPTWAGWLAEALLDLSRMENVGGIFHASGHGGVSWFDFAKAIFEWSSTPKTARLDKTTAVQFARPAPRPAYSVFDCSKLASTLGRPSIPWEEGLKRHLAEAGALRDEFAVK